MVDKREDLNSNIFISVIIPVFNGEQFVDRIIDQLNQQTFKKFEVIFVDDGSTDRSNQKINRGCEKATFNYLLCTQDNCGVSAARNKGIKYARGRYLYFLDVDDYILPNAFESLILAADNSNMNVIMSPIMRHKIMPNNTKIGQKILSKNDALKEVLYSKSRYSICGNLFNSDCFKNLLFPVGYKYSEDIYVLWQILANEEQIILIEAPMYFYRYNEHSAMNSPITAERNQAIDLMKKLAPVIRVKAPEFYDNFVRHAIPRHYWSILWQAACSFCKYDEFIAYADDYCVKEELKKLYDYPDFLISLSSKMYNLAPRIYYLAIRLYRAIYKKY